METIENKRKKNIIFSARTYGESKKNNENSELWKKVGESRQKNEDRKLLREFGFRPTNNFMVDIKQDF